MFDTVDNQLIIKAVDTAWEAIVLEDPDGRVLVWNRGAEALYGFKAEHVIGQTIEALGTQSVRDRLNLKGEEVSTTLVSQKTQDGSSVQVWLRSHILRDSDGRLLAYQHCARDAQQTPQQELNSLYQATVAAEQRFTIAVKAAPCGMLMIDSDGLVTMVNEQIEEIFGYTRSELIGTPIERLVPSRLRKSHVLFRQQFNRDPVARRMDAGAELVGLRKDRSEVPVEIGLNPITTEEGKFVLASVIDCTTRRQATAELVSSLRDRELLLQEIHHRVKNNLAVIGSILYLQSSTTNDPELLRVLQECQERVRSMSLVHERLYLTGDLGKLDFADYVKELAEQLSSNNVLTGQRVSLDFQLTSLPLNLKQAVPCGLILNELLTNAFKHAFQQRSEGKVSVSLARSTIGRITLTVSDDGKGFLEADLERSNSLGIRLVRSLTRQLDGEFVIEHPPEGGVRAILNFNEMTHSERG